MCVTSAKRMPSPFKPSSSAPRHDVGPGSMSATPPASLTTAAAMTWGLPRNCRSTQPRPGARTGMRWARHYTERQVVQSQALLAGIARLVSDESSLERTLSRAAVLLHEAIAFERLHVLRLDRTESVALYVVRASGEVDTTGHLIGDAPSPSVAAPLSAEQSRLMCTVGQGSHVKGAAWLTSSEANAFTDADHALP